jgi:hypothetical protein
MTRLLKESILALLFVFGFLYCYQMYFSWRDADAGFDQALVLNSLFGYFFLIFLIVFGVVVVSFVIAIIFWVLTKLVELVKG